MTEKGRERGIGKRGNEEKEKGKRRNRLFSASEKGRKRTGGHIDPTKLKKMSV